MKIKHVATATTVIAALAAAGMAMAQPPAGGRAGAAAPPPPLPLGGATVKLGDGQVQGSVAGGVDIYRGIPFAAPPVGDLRWKAPAAPAKWTGVKAANVNGGGCAQVEDCLYVNVFTPEGTKLGAKLPVMVWIYGGAFTGGSNALYDGTSFAKAGVIYVALNYRLGRAGWFAHPALTKEAGKGPNANYGTMDQIAALKWVQKNIAAFGGDAKNVTIFGESAGAISVNYLMLAPEAKGLFAKAISESGFGRLAAKPLADAEQTGATFAKANGITGDDAAAAKAMRALSWDDMKKGPLPLGSVGPIADGHLITNTALAEFRQGKEAKVPYMVGGNSDEASLTRSTTNTAQRMAAITTGKDVFLAAFDPDKQAQDNRTIARVVTDELISEPDREMARDHSKDAPTYVYHFSYTPMATRATALGLGHGGEIGYVFNTPRGAGFDAEGTSVSAAANAYWVAFAKTGNPGSAGGPAWPKWDDKSEPLMEFGPKGAAHVEEHFHKARLDWIKAEQEK